MSREERIYVFDMDSRHTWRYEVLARSFAEAVRLIVDGANVSYGQLEQSAFVMPSTAQLVEVRKERERT